MVGEHLNVRLALCLTESKDHCQPGAQGRRLPARALLLLLFCSLPHCLLLPWQQAILGQPRLCVAVPNGGVARGNGAYLEGLSKPSPGTLEIVYFLARSSKKNHPTRSDPACAPDSGALGELQLGSHNSMLTILPPKWGENTYQIILEGQYNSSTKATHTTKKSEIQYPLWTLMWKSSTEY